MRVACGMMGWHVACLGVAGSCLCYCRSMKCTSKLMRAPFGAPLSCFPTPLTSLTPLSHVPSLHLFFHLVFAGQTVYTLDGKLASRRQFDRSGEHTALLTGQSPSLLAPAPSAPSSTEAAASASAPGARHETHDANAYGTADAPASKV